MFEVVKLVSIKIMLILSQGDVKHGLLPWQCLLKIGKLGKCFIFATKQYKKYDKSVLIHIFVPAHLIAINIRLIGGHKFVKLG